MKSTLSGRNVMTVTFEALFLPTRHFLELSFGKLPSTLWPSISQLAFFQYNTIQYNAIQYLLFSHDSS